jgi:hypothetical protein
MRPSGKMCMLHTFAALSPVAWEETAWDCVAHISCPFIYFILPCSVRSVVLTTRQIGTIFADKWLSLYRLCYPSSNILMFTQISWKMYLCSWIRLYFNYIFMFRIVHLFWKVIQKVVYAKSLCSALILCPIFLSGRQSDCVVWTGSRLHVWWVAHTSIRHHARQESGHGGRKETEVCNATTSGRAYRNKENLFCQLYRNMQDVS